MFFNLAGKYACHARKAAVGGAMIVAAFVSCMDAGSATTRGGRDARASVSSGQTFSGIASFYGTETGSLTATGKRYNPEGLTAAHRTLPFGTRLKVTDEKTGRSVVVTVNDRGPYIAGRVLDLSVGAARAIGLTERGITRIKAEVL